MQTPFNVKITEKTCKNFFRCLGKFSLRDGQVTQKEADTVLEIWKEWGVSRETSQILLEELIAGRDSEKTFEQLFDDFKRDMTPADRCSCDIVHAFVNIAYAREQQLPQKVRQRLIAIGKFLSREEFLQNLMSVNDDFCEPCEKQDKRKTKLEDFRFG